MFLTPPHQYFITHQSLKKKKKGCDVELNSIYLWPVPTEEGYIEFPFPHSEFYPRPAEMIFIKDSGTKGNQQAQEAAIQEPELEQCFPTCGSRFHSISLPENLLGFRFPGPTPDLMNQKTGEWEPQTMFFFFTVRMI